MFSDVNETGAFFLTNIIGNNVQVKNYPSPEGRAIYSLNSNDIVQAIGFSGASSDANGVYGFWVSIIHWKTEDEHILGWVFSKDINITDHAYSPIRFVEFNPVGQSSHPDSRFLRMAYIFQGDEVFFNTWGRYWNGYYFFVFRPFNHNFNYSNRPGVYSLNRETLQLRHETYLGASSVLPHAWTVFTEDRRFLLQDSGAGPGVRGITAWRLSDFEQVFTGGYFSSSPPIIAGNIIEIVYMHDDLLVERGFLTDEEIISFGRNFREENPVPQERLEGLHPTISIGLIIQCSFNLDTGERIILGGEWILLQ